MKSDLLLTPILADEVSTGGVIVSRIILALRYMPKYIRRLMAGVCLPLRTSGYKSRHTINQASDAYNTGDKVTYNGKHYVSLIDGNIWTPDAYPAGWEEM